MSIEQTFTQQLPVVLSGDVPCPQYATPGAAAVDLHANLEEPVTLYTGTRRARLIGTGVAIQLPVDQVALLAPRSGLALHHGVTLANEVGVIDSDYTGEVFVALVNRGPYAYVVRPGDRIAQLLVMPLVRPKLMPVEALEETERAAGAFGSTGVGQ